MMQAPVELSGSKDSTSSVLGHDVEEQVGYRKSSMTRKGENMSNSDALRGMFERVCAGDVDGIAKYLADDFVEHEIAPGIEPTKAGTKQLFQMLISAYPDLRFDAEDFVESGDKVAVRVRITGTNKGDFMGIPATGKKIDIEGIDIVRFGDDGLALEHWGVMDVMAMMQQIGAIPEGPPPA